jgi:hypothetical protein
MGQRLSRGSKRHVSYPLDVGQVRVLTDNKNDY